VGTFATGVTIITTGRDGTYHGLTANAFTSLSLEPTLVLVCVDKSSDTYPVLDECGAFTVNVLAEDQEELSRSFATKVKKGGNKLNDLAYHVGGTGVPMLDDCLAYIECTTVQKHDGGDHTIFVGEVGDARVARDVPPLLYFRSSYRRIQP
jgi:flavin reductase (DIM6/NTAB) family NADH-FMN oxidoreductase RutF